jgi:hypothetical protein
MGYGLWDEGRKVKNTDNPKPKTLNFVIVGINK